MERSEEELEVRCRQMLTDLAVLLVDSNITKGSSARDLDVFIDDFMFKHNLSEKRKYEKRPKS